MYASAVLDRVLTTISRYSMLKPGGRVIAAANADIHAVALAVLQDVIDG